MEVLTKPSKVVATASEILNHSCWSEQLDRRRKLKGHGVWLHKEQRRTGIEAQMARREVFADFQNSWHYRKGGRGRSDYSKPQTGRSTKMKRLIMIATLALCGTLLGQIETRPVTFAANEIPATNPRVEKAGDMTTHIELFAPFVENGDGSVSTTVAESAITMDAVSVASWEQRLHAPVIPVALSRFFGLRRCTALTRQYG